MFDPEKFGEAMGDAIREAVSPLLKRIADLEEQARKPVDVGAEIERAVAAAVAGLPAPKDGNDAVLPDVKQMVAEAVAALPVPKNGDPGKSFTIDDARPLIDAAIIQIRKDADEVLAEPLALAEKARDMLLEKLGELKQPADGASVTVEDVAPLVRSEVERAVSALPAPKDGLGVAGAMIDRDGALQITLTNGEVKSLGLVVGRDGEDGKDGLSLDGFELEYLPESHEIAIKATAAGRVKEMRYPAGGIRPAGYWREGTKAQAGEAWVHDGSTFYARSDTAAKPEAKSTDWIIGARRGRDGETTIKTVNGGPPAPIKLQG